MNILRALQIAALTLSFAAIAGLIAGVINRTHGSVVLLFAAIAGLTAGVITAFLPPPY